MHFSRRQLSIAGTWALLVALSGCTPSSGSTERANEPDGAPGAGTASLNFEIGPPKREPNPEDLRRLEAMPLPPAEKTE
jgi:hypothetical protein